MKYFLLVIKGVAVGATNIVPGISGATLAVIFHIYDTLISSVNTMFSDPKNSLKFLVPFGIGMVAGIIGLAELITFLLTNFPLQTLALIVGLMFGSLRFIYKRSSAMKSKPLMYVIAVVFGAAIIALNLFTSNINIELSDNITFSIMLYFFVGGAIAAATMIVPGVSGAIVLTMLGLYTVALNILSQIRVYIFDPLNFGLLPPILLTAIPLGLGVIFGIVVCSKIIGVLLKKAPAATYAGILGLVAGTIAVVIINTNAFEETTLGVMLILASMLTFGAGTAVSLLLGKK